MEGGDVEVMMRFCDSSVLCSYLWSKMMVFVGLFVLMYSAF